MFIEWLSGGFGFGGTQASGASAFSAATQVIGGAGMYAITKLMVLVP